MSRWSAALLRAWTALRQVSGDDAYERYLRHARSAHPGAEPLDRRAYWLQRQSRRYDGVTRCC